MTQKIIALSFIIAVLLSCKENGKKEINQIKKITSEKGHKNAHWSHHKGADVPINWETLCNAFSGCAGNAQSPINIITKNAVKKDSLLAPIFNYGKSRVDIINNSHTIQFNIFGNNKVKLNGKNYKLLQFHYHSSSEHTIDGKYYPIEVHFVHQHSATDFAVIGILFKEGEENELFKEYLENFPKSKGNYTSKDEIDLLSLLPNKKSYFNYTGSLTTPPCSEVVNWYILKESITASKEQITKLSKILNNNYRPIQPLNNREVKIYLAPGVN